MGQVNLIGIAGKIGSGKDTVALIIQWLTNTAPFDQTFEEYLKDKSRDFNDEWKVKKFAYKLKQIVSLLTGATMEQLEDQNFKTLPLGDEWDYVNHYSKEKSLIKSPDYFQDDPAFDRKRFVKKYTYREMLQIVGTDLMRDQLHENVWVNALFAEYRKTTSGVVLPVPNSVKNWGDYPKWLVTDVRFPNEAKAIEQRGGVTIRINRPDVIDTTDLPGINKTAFKLRLNEHPSETALDDYLFDYTIDNDDTIEELVEKVKVILKNLKLL